ncbi:MAG: hypothetical protein ACR2M8_07455, partial [Pyrinomonadaceae bacterium]
EFTPTTPKSQNHLRYWVVEDKSARFMFPVPGLNSFLTWNFKLGTLNKFVKLPPTAGGSVLW